MDLEGQNAKKTFSASQVKVPRHMLLVCRRANSIYIPVYRRLFQWKENLRLATCTHHVQNFHHCSHLLKYCKIKSFCC